MEKESSSLPEAKPNKQAWIILAIVGLCAALGSCMLVSVAGGFFLRPFLANESAASELQTIPAVKTVPIIPATQTHTIVPTRQTSAALPPTPSQTPTEEALAILDYEAEPLFGSVELQRGFLPDPFFIYADAGGDLDTSSFGLDCGFTTSAPTFAFSLSGGASETFLRVFFAAIDRIDSTLVIHTPDQQWLCTDNSSFGSGTDPVIDIEFAPSGDYAVWVGAQQSGTYGMGSLNITGSVDTTP